MKEKVTQLIAKRYPALSPEVTGPLISENLFSPFQIKLAPSVLTQAQNFVREVYQYRESTDYQKPQNIPDPGNKSILMSYDFHLDSFGNLKLIEINTNASFLALGDLMYEAHGLKQPVADFSLSEILENIQEELLLNGQKSPADIAIIDEEPEKQRLYIEFLVFNEFFKQAGLRSQICDYRKIPAEANFIYNRLTDFYFSNPESTELNQLFQKKLKCFSPNPFEYDLLANKERMIEWSMKGLFPQNLPLAKPMTLENKEEIWAQRKKFFFKPMSSYGSKQSYRGAKISRKMFDEMPGNQFIAQEYIEPSTCLLQTPEGEQEFKYDLRFYAYKGRVQSALARLYQGQLTNLKTPYGGFAPVLFTK
jgi:hypothetical protein